MPLGPALLRLLGLHDKGLELALLLPLQQGLVPLRQNLLALDLWEGKGGGVGAIGVGWFNL